MLSTEAKLQIIFFYSDLKVRVYERQYAFILNLSAIAIAAIAFLRTGNLVNKAYSDFSIIFFSISLISSIVLMFASTEFDLRAIMKEEKLIKNVMDGKAAVNYKDNKAVNRVLNVIYYLACSCFLLGVVLALFVIF